MTRLSDIEQHDQGESPVKLEDVRMLRKARENERIVSYLRWAEICRIRAKVRNGMRGYLERSETMAGLTGNQYIPALSPNDINIEEHERRERKMKKMAGEEEDVHPERLLAYAAEPVKLDLHEIRQSEFVKYLGTKLLLFLEHGEYARARVFMDKMRAKMKDPKMKVMFEDELTCCLALFLTECVREKDTGTMIEAFMEIGDTVKVLREDLVGVKDGQLNDKELSGKIERQIRGFKGESLDLSQRMEKYFTAMGLKMKVK
jgi:hypothetical protein